MVKTKKKKNVVKKTGPAVMSELNEIYKNAKGEGIYIVEFKSEKGYLAAAGYMKVVEEMEKKLGVEIDVSKLDFDDLVNLTEPGIGKTRAEACRTAVESLKKNNKK